MQIGLNEERKLRQLKLNIDDAARKSCLMEDEAESIVQRWEGRILVIQKQLEEDISRSQSQVLGELVDKYIQQVFDKNRRIVEVQRVKEEIESKIQSKVSEKELKGMQDELKELIG